MSKPNRECNESHGLRNGLIGAGIALVAAAVLYTAFNYRPVTVNNNNSNYCGRPYSDCSGQRHESHESQKGLRGKFTGTRKCNDHWEDAGAH